MSKGRYGIHGGQYISETLMNELIHLEECRCGSHTVLSGTCLCDQTGLPHLLCQQCLSKCIVDLVLGMECEIFMGKEDTDRQALNVYRMELLGAKVHPVTSGTMTLKDAVNETMLPEAFLLPSGSALLLPD